MRELVPVLCLVAAAACSATPARFADAPPVWVARDTLPSPVPRHDVPGQSEYLTEIYMRRPVMDALDLSRFPRAGDVNSLDEVVHSSWFRPDAHRLSSLQAYAADGPPRIPWTATGEQAGALSIVDSRGLAYVLVRDDPAWPEMKTAADAITNRLLWAMGYITPEVHVLHASASQLSSPGPQLRAWFGGTGTRVTATRWPMGLELGPATPGLTRADDPNDRLEHRDRRTLRSLRATGAWLDLRTIGSHKTHDVYVGPPGCGHVVHYLTGFSDSLGTTRVVAEVAAGAPLPDCGPMPAVNFFTLGLAPDPRSAAASRRLRGLGAFDEQVEPARYSPDLPPYEPLGRAQPEDGYWATRRLMRLQPGVLREAVEAGNLSEPSARERLVQVLQARRRKVAAYWMQQVTPVQLEAVDGWSLWLRDEAVASGLAAPETTSYRVVITDVRGRALFGPVTLKPGSPCFGYDIPAQGHAGYVIVRLTALRGAAALPRAAEFHLVAAGKSPRLVGVLH
jgi:hypothetical protein